MELGSNLSEVAPILPFSMNTIEKKESLNLFSFFFFFKDSNKSFFWVIWTNLFLFPIGRLTTKRGKKPIFGNSMKIVALKDPIKVCFTSSQVFLNKTPLPFTHTHTHVHTGTSAHTTHPTHSHTEHSHFTQTDSNTHTTHWHNNPTHPANPHTLSLLVKINSFLR